MRKTFLGTALATLLIVLTAASNSVVSVKAEGLLQLTTDKNIYTLGEEVKITLRNIGDTYVSIGGWPCVKIYTYPDLENVWPRWFQWLAWGLAPGESETWTWDQYNAITGAIPQPGTYVVKDNKGWGLSAYFQIAEILGPDLSIEGILFPYFGMVPYYIYPTPDPEVYYRINVTVANLGTADAGRFNVSFTVYLEGEIMSQHGRKKTLAGLNQGAEATFAWDFDPQNYGLYTLVITADCDDAIAELDETNNAKTAQVRGTINGDWDGDGDVDYSDFIVLAGAYGSVFGQPAYNPYCDSDIDGDVDYSDFVWIAGNYGQHI